MNQYIRRYCPECERANTEQVHVEWHADGLEETRVCDDCPTQYTVGYNLAKKEVDEYDV